jgi:hypothetical protein
MHNKALRDVTLLSFISVLTIPEALAEERRARGFAGNRPVVVHSTPYWGWGGWGDPFWEGYYSYSYSIDTRGMIRIKGADKSDQVFLNGAYAGTIEKMKSIRLDPGKYNIEVRQQGRDPVNRDVYVVTGKTVEVHVNPGLNE